MVVPEKYRRDGSAVDLFCSTDAVDGRCMVACYIFLTEVPDSINLTTQADMDYDITKPPRFRNSVYEFLYVDGGMSLSSRLMVER